MEYLKYVIIGIVVIFLCYLTFRVISMAIFKSWFDAKNQNGERSTKDEIIEDAGHNGNKVAGSKRRSG